MRGTPTTRLVDIKRENGESKNKGEVVNDMTRKRRSGQKKVWPCGICENTLPTKRALLSHKKTIHPKTDDDIHTYKFDALQELFTCNTCSAEFQLEGEVLKHIKSHDENFKCKICDKKFKRAYDFGTHNYTHSEDKMFQCPLCIYKSGKRTAFLVHINYVHLKKFSYVCELCGKGFNDPVLFKEHDNEHKGTKPFSCIVCSKSFTYSRYLYTHQLRSHTVFIDGQLLPNQCVLCNKTFAKEATLEKHFKERHSRNQEPRAKRHLCDTCGKGFSQKHKLIIHHRVHTGFKPYSCSFCSKSFIKKDYLVMHERVHSLEKPHACEFCGKCFSQGAPLRIHRRIHTGERPYECRFCSAGFSSKAALNGHYRNCKCLKLT